MKKRIYIILCLLLGVAAGAYSQHWSVNPHAFQYDMTAYVTLKDLGTAEKLADYELAAFYGDECRGVGKMLTTDGEISFFQLRIRSNVTSGETITFNVYCKSSNLEFIPANSLSFESQSVAGSPSNPLLIDLPTQGKKGDVNMDDVVDVTDVVLIIDDILGKNPNNYNDAFADVNGDGDIDVTDVVLVIDFILGKISLDN